MILHRRIFDQEWLARPITIYSAIGYLASFRKSKRSRAGHPGQESQITAKQELPKSTKPGFGGFVAIQLGTLELGGAAIVLWRAVRIRRYYLASFARSAASSRYAVLTSLLTFTYLATSSTISGKKNRGAFST